MGGGLRGKPGKIVDGVFPGRPQSLRHPRRPADDCSPGREGEWRITAEQGAERFMAKWIAAEKARAGLRHTFVCPNVTGRTKERIAQRKRARAGSHAIIVDYNSYKWRELVSSRRMSCCLSLVLRLFCFVSLPLSASCFVSVSSFFSFLWRYHFSEYFCTIYRFIFVMESSSYGFSFRMVFFYLLATGWIFYISLLLCDKSIKIK